MQAHKFNSIAHCVRDTYHTEGTWGFFRGTYIPIPFYPQRHSSTCVPGMSIPLVTITFVRTTSFSIYEASKRFFGGILLHPLYSPPRPPRHQFEPHAVTTPPYHGFFGLNAGVAFLAGCLSGAFITVLSCPFEFTKLASQIELLVRRQNYAPFAEIPLSTGAKSPLQVAREIYISQGVRGFYSGFGYHLGNDIPSHPKSFFEFQKS